MVDYRAEAIPIAQPDFDIR